MYTIYIMEDTIAIDIVLLPPQEIWDLSVSLSRDIREQNPESDILLDDTHLPHITLVQASVDNLEEIYKVTKKSLADIRPLPFNVECVMIDENGTVGLSIVKTKELQQLHNDLMSSIEKFRRDVDSKAFYLDSDQAVGRGTLDWVQNFTQHTGYEKYIPHITLGRISSSPKIEQKRFIADRVAVCHLGNHCTCRKILKEWQLI